MQASWELEDATRVVAKMVSPGKLMVLVNGTQVEATTKRSGFLTSQTDFTLPQGRKASVSVRPCNYGEPEIDLHIDGRAVLFPGRRSLVCPCCHNPTRPQQLHCASCGSAQPSRAQRIQERRRSGLSRLLFLIGIIWPGVILASLLRGLFVPSESAASGGSQRTFAILFGCVLLLTVSGVLALLAKRMPLLAASANAAFWAFMCLFANFRATEFSWAFLCVEALMAFYSYRAFVIAREIRQQALAEARP